MSDDRPQLKILLVDDSDDDRCFFTYVFRQSGVSGKLLQSEDGEDAVKLLSQATASGEVPHAMFLDLKMPGRNGFDVLEWLRQQPVLHPLAVFVLTGSDSPADIKRARDLGAKGYIVKPITAEKIRELLSPLITDH